MIKKYLTTPEEILALKDTDTKIYVEHQGGYYKFVGGVLCYFHSDGKDFHYQTGLWMSQNPYILVEEPVKEVTEKNIGKLGWFYNDDETNRFIDIVSSCDSTCGYAASVFGGWFKHFCPLTPAEVAEITGYKVEEN